MEQGMLSQHQEFGGTAWLALPGQNPALVRALSEESRAGSRQLVTLPDDPACEPVSVLQVVA